MKSTAETLKANFPYPQVGTINGFPTYEALDRLRQKICANASSVPSARGGGRHGHVGMCLDPAVYSTLSNSIFAPPVNPGLTQIQPAPSAA